MSKSRKKPQSDVPAASKTTDKKPKAGKITFHYIKSNQFRVIHVDGVHGGPSPRGQLQMAFFNERLPIPQQVTHTVDEARELGPEVLDERIGKEGIVREVEVELLLNLDVAKSIHKWLGDKIGQVEKLIAPQSPEEN